MSVSVLAVRGYEKDTLSLFSIVFKDRLRYNEIFGVDFCEIKEFSTSLIQLTAVDLESRFPFVCVISIILRLFCFTFL